MLCDTCTIQYTSYVCNVYINERRKYLYSTKKRGEANFPLYSRRQPIKCRTVYSKKRRIQHHSDCLYHEAVNSFSTNKLLHKKIKES